MSKKEHKNSFGPKPQKKNILIRFLEGIKKLWGWIAGLIGALAIVLGLINTFGETSNLLNLGIFEKEKQTIIDSIKGDNPSDSKHLDPPPPSPTKISISKDYYNLVISAKQQASNEQYALACRQYILVFESLDLSINPELQEKVDSAKNLYKHRKWIKAASEFENIASEHLTY